MLGGKRIPGSFSFTFKGKQYSGYPCNAVARLVGCSPSKLKARMKEAGLKGILDLNARMQYAIDNKDRLCVTKVDKGFGATKKNDVSVAGETCKRRMEEAMRARHIEAYTFFTCELRPPFLPEEYEI